MEQRLRWRGVVGSLDEGVTVPLGTTIGGSIECVTNNNPLPFSRYLALLDTPYIQYSPTPTP